MAFFVDSTRTLKVSERSHFCIYLCLESKGTKFSRGGLPGLPGSSLSRAGRREDTGNMTGLSRCCPHVPSPSGFLKGAAAGASGEGEATRTGAEVQRGFPSLALLLIVGLTWAGYGNSLPQFLLPASCFNF